MNLYASTRLPNLALKLAKCSQSATHVHSVCTPVCSVLRLAIPGCGYTNQRKHFSQSQSKVLYQAEGMAAKIEAELKNNKNVEIKKDDQGRLIIYEGTLKRQIRSVKLFSLSTSAMGLALQPTLLAQTADSGLFAKIALFGTVGFFTFVTPLLIHTLAKRYVTQFLYSPETDTYTAVTVNFFNLAKETQFKVEDVIVPDVSGPFTNFLVSVKNNGSEKKIPMFVAPDSFIDIVHYGRIMGFDKPVDLRLNSEVEETIQRKQDAKNKST